MVFELLRLEVKLLVIMIGLHDFKFKFGEGKLNLLGYMTL